MSGIHSGPEYEAWLQRWKDAAVLIETDELAALKEGKTLIQGGWYGGEEDAFDYTEVLPLMPAFTKVMMEHDLMVGQYESKEELQEVLDSRSHNREGCEICTMMLASKPERETVWASGSEGCGGNCECNCD